MKKIRVGWIVQKTNKYHKQRFKPLYERLNEFSELDIQIDAFEKGDWGEEYIFPSYIVRNLISKFSLSNNKTFETKRWSKHYDLIHIMNSFLFSKLLPMVNCTKRPKTIVSLHGGDTYIKPWIDEKWREYYFLDNKYNLVDKYLVRSNDQATYLVNNWNVDANKVVVSGVGTSMSLALGKRVLKKNKKIKIVSVFRLVWEKNIFQSLLFIKKLKNLGIDIEYHILGSGSNTGQLMYLINRLELNKIVFAHGYCEPETVTNHLDSSCFILQLSISEALSASLIEAQAKGLVPIVFDSGGIPEAVTLNNKTSALMAELGDIDSLIEQFLELLKNPHLYSIKSETALEVVKSKFMMDHEVNRLRSIYNSLYD